jgi:predicted SAM-dependent methyltransferase
MQIKSNIKNIIKYIIPHGIYVFYKQYKERKLFYEDEKPSFCPICEKSSYFLSFGFPTRIKSKCQHCGSLERHRLLWLFLKRETNFFLPLGKKLLHIAPESCFIKIFKKTFGYNYINADLNNSGAIIKMDITNIQYPENYFDIIICSHVLEHVKNDRKAMREFYRVLKGDGFAIFLVPIFDIEKTYEDYSINTEGGKIKAFGQKDHVRKYGKDYSERLLESGFKVKKQKADDILNNDEIINYSIKKCTGGADEIFYCTKL